jgi:hypothetical protein
MVHVLIVTVDQEAVTTERFRAILRRQAHRHGAALRVRERLADVIRADRDRPDVSYILLGGIVQSVIDAGIAKTDQCAITINATSLLMINPGHLQFSFHLSLWANISDAV